jgi:hypothetical protein
MIGDEIIKMALARFSRLENDNADIDTIVTIRNVKQNRAVSVLENSRLMKPSAIHEA